MELQALLTTQP